MVNLEETKYHVDFGEYYVRMTDKQKRYLVVRSVIDRILAGIALVILSPLFLIVSIAQKISAPDEPIFFLQKRVGRNAHCFNIIKFRTMKSSAPKNAATGDLADPQIYISRLGRFLRDTSIDELPQLVNVVNGDMSLIGPRPLVYTEREIRFLRRWYGVYQVTPGITGWAQVNGRDTVDIYDKVYYDREYVQNVSLKFDLKVIWKSVLVVLGRKGVVDGKVDPEFRKESIVLLRESQLVQNRKVECTDENKLPMM
ncbi:sugar transferase [Faecalibacterium prausnitzii]|jgi:O-antigen biosynthesis protein WbqP|uniref:Sugar transferase n=1 Tax=Faecalibacterium prausnitzii TaxID=853 RepID=A0A3E2V4X0_9FIRM|nr:sugar transferase [Faecalibacterium prausnitzii]RGC05561.1 sugar transferase [Faecalibacterium prausnitzii]RGC34707.1 sugar transferase [Faecalibacterium prausnitzii]